MTAPSRKAPQMFARHTRHVLVATIATLALAIPGTAIAGPSGQLSAVDALSSDVAVDGTASSTSPSTTSSASDSPAIDTYSGGGVSVPPPVDCLTAPATTTGSASASGDSSTGTSAGTSAGTSSSSSSSSSSVAAGCAKIVECSASDTDGKDQNGKPCVECSSVDTDGTDASGKPCVTAAPATTSTAPVAAQPCTDAGVGGSGVGLSVGTPVQPVKPTRPTACGGGGVVGEPGELTVEAPEPVVGGGTDEPAPAEALGGGGPELPFTGLPLSWAIGGGFGLILLGMTFWARGRFGTGS